MMVSGKTVTSNFLWRLMERIGAQGVSLVVSVVLARKLAPSEYGEVALISVFIALLSVFINSGFSYALVQKKNVDDLDYSSVFYFNIFMCSVLYLVMFFSAPLIASFYNNAHITPVIRVQSIGMLISGVKSVQGTYVSKNLMFRKFFFATLSGTIGAAFVGVGMAYAGFGVWALVVQDLFNNFVDTVILWFTVKWRPKWMFSIKRLRGMFSFGWKLLLSDLLDTGYNKLRQLVIGKRYNLADLAFFDKGDRFPNLFATNINSSITSVLFPTMATAQDDKDEVRRMTRRSIKVSTYLIMPVMAGFAACSKPFVDIVLTAKWEPAIPFIMVFCFSYAFWPVHTANLSAIKAMGRSDIFLKLEIIKKVVGFTAILIAMRISPFAIAATTLITGLISQVINAWPNKKLLNYSYIQQLKDMMPSIFLSLTMFAAVYSLGFLHINNYLTLVLQISLGVAVYIGGSILFKFDSFYYVKDIAKGFLKKKGKANT